LITAMLVGDRPVAMSTHCPSGVAIGSLAPRRPSCGSPEMRSGRRGGRARAVPTGGVYEVGGN
jgi:hypothetical protein